MMIKGIEHKLARLRAMSTAEIVHRMGNTAHDWLEQFRVLFFEENYEPTFSRNITERAWNGVWRTSALPNSAVCREQFPDCIEKTCEMADQLLSGKHSIFGQPVNLHTVNWHCEPISGHEFPQKWWSRVNIYNSLNIEIKYVWELNRLQHLIWPAKAFYLTKDEKYTNFIIEQLDSWWRDNPYNIGVNWSSSLELAFRIITLTWVLRLIQDSQKLDTEIFHAILHTIWQHAIHIENHLSKYSSANNHLIGEAVGLLYTGSFFPELPGTQTWREKGFAIMQEELLKQTFSDGVGKEQAIHYQKYIIDLAVLAAHAASLHKLHFSTEWHERLEKMVDFVAALIEENGYIPQIGDEDGGEALHLYSAKTLCYHETLNTAALYLNTPPCVLKKSENALWIFPEKHAKQKPAPASNKEGLTLFEKGGYAIIKQADQKVCFDFGDLGLGNLAAHGHADALSIWLNVKGQPALIDSNTYLYLGAGPLRHYFRSTAAHNTVVIDGKNQSQINGPFQWGKKAASRLEHVQQDDKKISVHASHNGYADLDCSHTRKIEWIKNSAIWEIKDIIKSNKQHDISLFFHTAAHKIDILKNSAFCKFDNFSLTLSFTANQSFTLIAHGNNQSNFWHSSGFGKKEKGITLECRAQTINTCKVTTIIQTHDN